MELVAKQLALDADQRAAFDRFVRCVRTMRMKSGQLRETNQPLIDAAWQDFAKQQPDEAAIDKLFEQAANNRRSFQIETGRALREFLVALSEEQREKLIALVKDRDRNTPPLLRQLVQ
jgi:Spy/CpxP family protein refolding chaperone